MRKLAIIHFSPIELYPLVMNLLRHLEQQPGANFKVLVLTQAPAKEMKPFSVVSPMIVIKRVGQSNQKKAMRRYAGYLRYYANCLIELMRWKPNVILYFETLSAFPALAYLKMGKSGTSIFAHYHEYITPPEYEEGMLINRRAHRLEKKAYPSYAWISHTNADRMRLFRADNTNIRDEQAYILPNYPPKSWSHLPAQTEPGLKTRFVYVGALSMGNMYTTEFAQWIIDQDGAAEWDIFSNNITADTRTFIDGLASAHIRFRGAVDYFDLPLRLKDYDIGIILYKGTIANYVYNAPNKLFEYFACGLDIWFPDIMKSCYPYITHDTYPQIRAINFNQLKEISLADLQNRKDMQWKPSTYYFETIYPELFNSIEYFSNERAEVTSKVKASGT